MTRTQLQSQSRATSDASQASLWTGLLQHKCDCGNHTIAGGECAECGKNRSTLQRGSGNSELGNRNRNGLPPIVHDVLRSPGQPLDQDTRAFMEPRFGRDFSHVRVHADSRAAESARALNALAYTVGRNISFGDGQYLPGTSKGRELLAHELTHVVQQDRGGPVAPQRAPAGAETGDAPEKEAKAEATKVAADEKAGPAGAKPKPKKTPSGCDRKIFAEGTCADLVAGSKYICCDPTNGIERKGRKTDIDGTPCPSEKFTPIFTCDNKCDKALAKGCSDNDNWLALPDNQFSRSQCGDVWTICANGKQTTGYVRDHSVTDIRFEVSPKIQKDLGVKVGDSFMGAMYKPGANQAKIDKDNCCKS